jgi:hypothetical protein
MQSTCRGDFGPKFRFVFELALAEGADWFYVVRWRAGLFAGGHPSGYYPIGRFRLKRRNPQRLF